MQLLKTLILLPTLALAAPIPIANPIANPDPAYPWGQTIQGECIRQDTMFRAWVCRVPGTTDTYGSTNTGDCNLSYSESCSSCSMVRTKPKTRADPRGGYWATTCNTAVGTRDALPAAEPESVESVESVESIGAREALPVAEPVPMAIPEPSPEPVAEAAVVEAEAVASPEPVANLNSEYQPGATVQGECWRPSKVVGGWWCKIPGSPNDNRLSESTNSCAGFYVQSCSSCSMVRKPAQYPFMAYWKATCN